MTTNTALIDRSSVDQIVRCSAHAGRASRIQNSRPKALAAAMLRDADRQAAQIPFDGFCNSALTAAFDEGIAHELEWRIEEADYRNCSLTRDELEDCARGCVISDADAVEIALARVDRYEDEIDLLSLDVFKSESGDFIVDADLAVGGPAIRARCESRWDPLEAAASRGSGTVQLCQSSGETSDLKGRLTAAGEM